VRQSGRVLRFDGKLPDAVVSLIGIEPKKALVHGADAKDDLVLGCLVGIVLWGACECGPNNVNVARDELRHSNPCRENSRASSTISSLLSPSSIKGSQSMKLFG